MRRDRGLAALTSAERQRDPTMIRVFLASGRISIAKVRATYVRDPDVPLMRADGRLLADHDYLERGQGAWRHPEGAQLMYPPKEFLLGDVINVIQGHPVLERGMLGVQHIVGHMTGYVPPAGTQQAAAAEVAPVEEPLPIPPINDRFRVNLARCQEALRLAHPGIARDQLPFNPEELPVYYERMKAEHGEQITVVAIA